MFYIMYELIKKEGKARRGVFTTVHGTVQTPAFMNVGTAAAIKGGISSYDLVELKCQVELCNTYHLHLRPGDRYPGTGRAAPLYGWELPILTDSGGFQVFSLSSCGRFARKGYISALISTAPKFLWVLRRACKSSPISAPRSPWHLTNAWKILLHWNMQNSPVHAPPLALSLQGGNGAPEFPARYP